jgi:hypothetical protein
MAITTTVECDATLGIRTAKSFSDCQRAQLHVTFTTGKNAVCRCWIKDAEGRAFALGLSTTGLIELDKALQAWREKQRQAV